MATLLELILNNQTDRTRVKRSKAMPEVVRDEAWTFRSRSREGLQAGVDMKERVMTAPDKLDPQSLRIRTHEMGHVALTPAGISLDEVAEEDGVPAVLLDSLEDARIHQRFRRERVLSEIIDNGPFLEGDEEAALVAQAEALMDSWKRNKLISQKELSILGAAVRLATAQTPEEDFGKKVLAMSGGPSDEQVSRAIESVKDGTFEDVRAAARALWAELQESEGDGDGDVAKDVLNNAFGEAFDVTPNEDDGEEGDDDERYDENGNLMPRTIDGVPVNPLEDPEWVARRSWDEGSKNRWVPMRIVEPELRRKLKKPPRQHARPNKPRDDGGRFAAVHRLPLDGKVFRRRVRRDVRQRIGTLLIDVSGSMSLSNQMLDEVLTIAPQATVAIYSSIGDDGRLTVVARDGYRIADHPEHLGHGGSNGCDGPALRWLNEQSGPRIWVSDGMVTGYADNMAENLSKDAFEVARAGKVYQVMSCHQLLSEVG